jgi:hypothetical protein
VEFVSMIAENATNADALTSQGGEESKLVAENAPRWRATPSNHDGQWESERELPEGFVGAIRIGGYVPVLLDHISQF